MELLVNYFSETNGDHGCRIQGDRLKRASRVVVRGPVSRIQIKFNMFDAKGRGGRRQWLALAGMAPGWALGLAVLAVALSSATGASNGARTHDEGRGKVFSYRNDKIPAGPWSVHILKLDRSSLEYELDTVLAKDVIIGMETLTDQMKSFPTNIGRPVGAINGDFYRSGRNSYEGDPEGIQITHGELVSGPSGRACFWIDAFGQPRMDEVLSQFRVTWPDGSGMKMGLNEERAKDAIVLYTPRLGAATRTRNGREYILEPVSKDHWLPLRVGTRWKASVREVRETGNAELAAGTMVLSVGPNLFSSVPSLKVGDVIEISTATTPDMTDCKTAIGGGPRLVIDGKPTGGWRSPNDRHPRTAVGWNNDYLYLVLVDGRQPGMSMGMSFTELADYFVKLGCTTAVNLDGGGSASMWLLGQTVSSPSEGRERPIANSLVIVKKNRETAQLND